MSQQDEIRKTLTGLKWFAAIGLVLSIGLVAVGALQIMAAVSPN